ncbi:MAG: class I SAM-dependent methyltransferase [Ignisphaera sp.]|nr:class I SAM-dependent methyltransferase [Ignisphaera sp.]MCX8167798.1 class I SAM-dependent methyltransferase [Ignisphaera sp.]MDW8086193.1 class I SAM-dependent methyltransferase [Ignisphaera sp.]
MGLGSNLSNDVVYSYFIEKGEYFRIIMDSHEMVNRGKKLAKGIAKQLMMLGIDKGRILDIGCGTGRVALSLAELGYSVVGIDISSSYIEIAKTKARSQGVENRTEFIVCDARELDHCLSKYSPFNAVLFIWSSVIGYYDEDTDIRVLTHVRNLVDDKGVLIIADSINRDYLLMLHNIAGEVTWFYDYHFYVVVEKSLFNPVTSEVMIKHSFYRKDGRNLMFLDEAHFKMRVYSLNEMVYMAKKAGWCLLKVLRDVAGEIGYSFTKPLNVIFSACKK